MLRTAAALILPLPVIVTIYAIAPARPSGDRPAAIALAAGLLVFGGVMLICLRYVARADKPLIVASAAIMATVPTLLAVFAYVYLVMSTLHVTAFSEPLSRIDAFYFATSTFATVGYGDIAAVSSTARLTVVLQIGIDLLVIGGLIQLYLDLARRRRDERSAG